MLRATRPQRVSHGGSPYQWRMRSIHDVRPDARRELPRAARDRALLGGDPMNDERTRDLSDR
jgi:hypothetical protein